ncbi:MAG: DEAD/DEAH box helicase [Halobacteria archaeon]
MGLLLENAASAIPEIGGEPYKPEKDEVQSGQFQEIPVATIGSYCRNNPDLDHPRDRWVAIPLHEEDSAELTGEFLGYRDDEIYTESVLYTGESGRTTALDASEFATTSLARRVRFWHSDYVPPEKPGYYTSELDDAEQPVNPIEDTEEFFDGLREHIQERKEKSVDEKKELANRKTVEDISRSGGDAIPYLQTVERDGRIFRFKVEGRPADTEWYIPKTYGVHPGNRYVLLPPDRLEMDGFPVEGTVEDVNGLYIDLSVEWSVIGDVNRMENLLTNSGSGFGLVSTLNPIPYDREETAIDKAENSESLRKLLTGKKKLRFTETAGGDPLDDELNQEQEEAVRYSLLASDCFVLHGPPGTGKTRTLVEIIRRAVDSGERVLVAADSNQAVDNIVVGSGEGDRSSLHRYGQYGENEMTVERQKAVNSKNELVKEHYIDSGVTGRADVVCATNSSSANLESRFDLVLVDEATQSTITSTLIPVTKGDRFVLAGDHRQLPPYSPFEDPFDDRYGVSLFEHIYGDQGVYSGVGIKLRTQYRMHPEIMQFPNGEFYSYELRAGRKVNRIEGREHAVKGYNIGGRVELEGNSPYNLEEIEMVKRVLNDLEEAGVKMSDVGVISPYTSQVNKIRKRLDETDLNPIVDTIDSFQGSEREVIVVSFVRSNEDGKLGFLGRPEDGPRRLNVAITRAKRLLVVIGDLHTLRYDDEGKCNQVYQNFVDYLRNFGVSDVPEWALSG